MKGVVVVPPTKRIVPRTTQSEQRLRARIRTAFLTNDRARKVTYSKAVEDQILNLMKKYARASKDRRELVYREAEKRILRTLRSKQS
jgi:hypothetical protein